MDVTTTQVAAYVGAGAATATGLTALRHGAGGKAMALGVATGVVAGGLQSLVQGATGRSELGWAASAVGGAAAGALIVGSLASPGMSAMRARGIGAVIGGATGVLAPVLAGMVLAQLQPAE